MKCGSIEYYILLMVCGGNINSVTLVNSMVVVSHNRLQNL